MQKKFIFFISFLLFTISNISFTQANEKRLIPLKKPVLSNQEFKKKVSINVLKPLPKPNKQVTKEIIEEKIENITSNLNFSIPKKKPLITGIDKKDKIKKSRYYSQKDKCSRNKIRNLHFPRQR